MNTVRRTRGFTLVEVLVAFTIAAVGIALVFRIIGSSARAAALSQDYQRAAVIAESVLADPRHEWEAGDELDGFRWSVTQTEAAGLDDVDRRGGATAERVVTIADVAVTVEWQRGSRERQVRVVTQRIVDLDGNVLF